MARKRLSEYKAKSLLLKRLSLPYQGVQITDADPLRFDQKNAAERFVVKVDQGIKKRFKRGLIHLDVEGIRLPEALSDLRRKGYTQFLVEPFYKHEAADERYLALERSREGILVYTSQKGGVDIEEEQTSVRQFLLPKDSFDQIARSIGIEIHVLKKLIEIMDELHISFLEINPLVIHDKKLHFLDLAVEVDSAGAFFVNGAWDEKDFVGDVGGKTQEEKAIESLSAKSQASFRLVVLNQNGSIFMLLSGGGASIVLADEVYNQGKGHDLANYGEYSGNPNAEETYLYTRELLRLLIKSQSKKKVLIIAGGVANFTDVRITFRGIIHALAEVTRELKQHGVKIYVRRGGPYQEEGLSLMKEFLEKESLLGEVAGPEMVLSDIVAKALQEVAV